MHDRPSDYDDDAHRGIHHDISPADPLRHRVTALEMLGIGLARYADDDAIEAAYLRATHGLKLSDPAQLQRSRELKQARDSLVSDSYDRDR